jgi:hypothetical protein
MLQFAQKGGGGGGELPAPSTPSCTFLNVRFYLELELTISTKINEWLKLLTQWEDFPT